MQDKIGAVWKSTSTNPKAPFASGVIKVGGQEIRIVLWDNNKRPDKKDPDFQITLDTPKEQTPPVRPTTPPARPQAPPVNDRDMIDFTDDIPF